MYKKVKFEVRTDDESLRKIAEVVLTKGYPYGNVWFADCEGDLYSYVFNVNRNDLSDLRRDVEALVKGGIDIREVEAL